MLALVPIAGFFAANLAGIWLAAISLMLVGRSEVVDRLWDDAAEAQPPHTAP